MQSGNRRDPSSHVQSRGGPACDDKLSRKFGFRFQGDGKNLIAQFLFPFNGT
jgi:hypothetical protein